MLTSFVHFHRICSVGSLLGWFFPCSKNTVQLYMCLKKPVSQLPLFSFCLICPLLEKVAFTLLAHYKIVRGTKWIGAHTWFLLLLLKLHWWFTSCSQTFLICILSCFSVAIYIYLFQLSVFTSHASKTLSFCACRIVAWWETQILVPFWPGVPLGPAAEKLSDVGQIPEPLRIEDPSSKMGITDTFFSGQLENYDSIKTANVRSDKF